MKVQCCMCSRIRVGKRWRHALPGELSGEGLSTSYCSACAVKALIALREERAAWDDANALNTP